MVHDNLLVSCSCEFLIPILGGNSDLPLLADLVPDCGSGPNSLFWHTCRLVGISTIRELGSRVQR
jgi:hypothetical protein